MSGDCRALTEAKLVSQGKAVHYDIEDSDGCHHWIYTYIRDLRAVSAF